MSKSAATSVAQVAAAGDPDDVTAGHPELTAAAATARPWPAPATLRPGQVEQVALREGWPRRSDLVRTKVLVGR